MKKSLVYSRKHKAVISCLLFFAIYSLLWPLQMEAQSRSTSLSQLLSNRAARIQVSFAFSPPHPTAGQSIQFTDTSARSTTSWQWDFGDGTTATAKNPCHAFAASGFYRVTLTARVGAGSGEVSRPISVMPSASAAISTAASAVSFTYSPTSPTTGQAIQFTDTSTNSPTSWQWHFGDGMTSTSKNPSHTYGTAAAYHVTLGATNNSGTKTASQTVTVIPSSTLSASFTFSPASPAAGQAIQFTDTSTGSPTSWQWNFGDGTMSTAQKPSHTFATATSYTVTLTVTNSSGSKSVNQTVTVVAALAASFTFSPASPAAGQAIQFTDTSFGSPTSWQWNFGDGTMSTAQKPSHTFATAASYTVTLTVTNSSGSKSVNRTVTVVPALTASFTFSPASPAAGQAVQFTDTSSGSPTSWQWNFGDGTMSTAQKPSHTFATAASYTVTLTVTNSSGSDSMSRAINVLPASALIADFTYTPSSPVLGQAVNFSDTSTGNPTSWQWDFGDGATSTVQNPSYTYATAGAQSVTLIISAGSSSSTQIKNIIVTYADVITATSPSFTDVSAAVSSAKAGDTVIVPAGSATWESQLVITKGIYLIGAGIGSTNITSNYTAPSPGSPNTPENFLIRYEPASPSLDEPFRLSGFNFYCNRKCSGIMLRNYSEYGINKVRVDHCRIINPSPENWMFIVGNVFGVCDNCECPDGIVHVYGAGSTTWDNFTYTYGGAQQFYFEDCDLTNGTTGAFVGAEQCGRYCFRYCTFNMTRSAYPLWDAHGNYTGTGPSVMGVEIYNNTINGGGYDTGGLDQRGGKGLFFNNTFINMGSVTTRAREEYDDFLNPPATSTLDGSPQYVHNSYYFNNTRNGGHISEYYIEGTLDYGALGLAPYRVVPQKNVDVWWETDLTNPYTFDGTSGIGVGLLASRPNTGTAGVGYWATDTKILYRYTTKNVWEEFYKPYIYPHPLRTQLNN